MDNHAHYLRYRDTYIKKSRRNYRKKREYILQQKKEQYTGLSMEKRAALQQKARTRRQHNPEKQREAQRKWRLTPTGKASRAASRVKERKKIRSNPRINKNRHLKFAYGITLEQYEEMLREQGGTCALCPSSKRLIVDHNHSTGKVRGILCYACNTGLGHLERFSALGLNPKVVEYLKEE